MVLPARCFQQRQTKTVSFNDVLHCINLCCCSLSNCIPTPKLPAYHPFYLNVYPFFSLLSANVLSKQALQEEDSSDWRAAFHHIMRSWTQLPTSPPIYLPNHSFSTYFLIYSFTFHPVATQLPTNLSTSPYSYRLACLPAYPLMVAYPPTVPLCFLPTPTPTHLYTHSPI